MKKIITIVLISFIWIGMSNAQNKALRIKTKETGTKPSGAKIDRITFKAGTTVTDIDGNVYHTVKIGTQVWMVENLKVTKFNDGAAIPLVTDSSLWSRLTTPGYCWYNNDAPGYKNLYGALYNWRTVKTGKLCPIGWHVPNDSEWSILINYLGGEGVAGNKLNERGTSHWQNPNAGATNESGFTALPGGFRTNYGTFSYIGYYGYWWNSNMYDTYSARFLNLYYCNGFAYKFNYNKNGGCSIRCLMD